MRIKSIFIFILLFSALKFSGQDFGTSGWGNIEDKNGGLYWGATAIFSSINATTTTFNIKKLKNPPKPDKYKSNAIFGIISGTFQTLIGISNVSPTNKYEYIPTSINIGLGITTIVTSIMRLASKSPPKETKLVYNFFYLPSTVGNTSIVGLRVIRQLN